MRIKVLSGGRKNIELPLSDAELNLQMRRIGIGETVPMCRLVEVSEQDKEAREYLYGTSEMELDEEAAYEIMKEEAEQGNAYAMADMGKMYAQGIFVDADWATAQEWYEKALKEKEEISFSY